MTAEMKEVMVDARCFYTGIARYIGNVLREMRSLSGRPRIRVLCRTQHASSLRGICDDLTVSELPIYSIREQLRMPRLARHADLLHVPHYNAPVLYRGNLVVSILDLIHISHQGYRRRVGSWAYAWPMLSLVARRAARIITISEFSKQQIVERLHIAASKVTVIYCGATPCFRPLDRKLAQQQVREINFLSAPYVLYVGNLKPHKNLKRLVRAYSRSRFMREGHLLVIVGSGIRERRELVSEATGVGVQGAVHFIDPVDDENLVQLYNAAECLVMPSVLEGFGFPVLEAMSCGTPVVSSNAGPLPEVAGEAADYFDPTCEESILTALDRIADDEALRRRLASSGPTRASKFSWHIAAEQHAAIYTELLN